MCELKSIEHLHQKILFFLCVCMYKMNRFALFNAETWNKSDFEVIE